MELLSIIYFFVLLLMLLRDVTASLALIGQESKLLPDVAREEFLARHINFVLRLQELFSFQCSNYL